MNALLALIVSSILWMPFNILVDVEHPLPKDFAPGVNPIAKQHLDLLIEDAIIDGKKISVTSSYRSYEEQEWLVAENPANRAPAGCSEHQLGTAFDLAWIGYASIWGKIPNAQVWYFLHEHAHEYGFVISYPNKECDEWPYSNSYQAGCGVDYMYEPWHIRFVGIPLAKRMYEAGYLDLDSPVLPQDFYSVGW